MKIQVEIPTTTYVDNVGAIWLSNNQTTSERTKHVQIRTALVKEYQEEGKLLIKFVKSEENDADINTINTANVIFQETKGKLYGTKMKLQRRKISESIDQSTGRISRIYFVRLKL